MTKQSRLMLLAGPPGAGKTAVAHHLATTADRPTVHVPTDQLCLYRAFEHLGDREACVIDSSTLTIAETAEAVRHRDGRPTHRPPRG